MTDKPKLDALDVISRPDRGITMQHESQAELGAYLVTKASDRLVQRFHDEVVSQVENIVGKLRLSEQTRQACEKNIVFYETQLRAIHAGEFNVSPITGRIEFHNKELNQ